MLFTRWPEFGANNFGLDRESISIAEFTQIDFQELATQGYQERSPLMPIM